MSALPPKADMCSATRDVRFGPIADICRWFACHRSDGCYHSGGSFADGSGEVPYSCSLPIRADGVTGAVLAQPSVWARQQSRSWIFGRCIRRFDSLWFRKLCLRRWWLGGLLFGGLLLLFRGWLLNLFQLIVVRHCQYSLFPPKPKIGNRYASSMTRTRLTVSSLEDIAMHISTTDPGHKKSYYIEL